MYTLEKRANQRVSIFHNRSVVIAIFCFVFVAVYAQSTEAPLVPAANSGPTEALSIAYEISYPDLKSALVESMLPNKALCVISGGNIYRARIRPNGRSESSISNNYHKTIYTIYDKYLKCIVRGNRDDSLPEGFSRNVVKTDKVRTILGYECQEYKITTVVTPSKTFTNTYYCTTGIFNNHINYTESKYLEGVCLAYNIGEGSGSMQSYCATSIVKSQIDAAMFILPSGLDLLTGLEFNNKLKTDKKFEALFQKELGIESDSNATKSRWRIVVDGILQTMVALSKTLPTQTASNVIMSADSEPRGQMVPKSVYFDSVICPYCHGTGKDPAKERPARFGQDSAIMSSACRICGSAENHYHKQCPSCSGKGSVKKLVR